MDDRIEDASRLHVLSAVTQERWFKRLSKIALGLSIPVYLVSLFVSRELNFLSVIQVPVLTAAVLLIFLTLDRVAAGVEGLARDNAAGMQQLRQDNEVLRAIASRAIAELETRLPGEVRLYGSHGQFYTALQESLNSATDNVWTSYLRRHPPEKLGQVAQTYFAGCRAWAAASDAHRFRRLVTEPAEHDDLRRWLKNEECPMITHNYSVRVVPWKLRATDSLSIAIIDRAIVFVAFSGEDDQLSGYSFRNPQLVAEYERYYERIWSASRELGPYLNPKGRNRPAPESTI